MSKHISIPETHPILAYCIHLQSCKMTTHIEDCTCGLREAIGLGSHHLLEVSRRLSSAISRNWLTVNPQGADATIELLQEFKSAIAVTEFPAQPTPAEVTR